MEIEYDDLEYCPDGVFRLNGEPFSGTAIDRYPDGQKMSEVRFLDGREHGIARSWYQNGQLSGETPYVHGEMHGIRREFFEDGSVRSEEVVEFGVLMRKEVRDHEGKVVERFERDPSDVLYRNVLKRRADG